MNKINRTLKLLMFADVFTVAGFGFINPVISIFVKENLVGGTIAAAGIASAVFVITKSFIQLPFSKYVDKHDNKLEWLIVGAFVVATIPIIYIFIDNIWQIYAAQFLNGIGSALVFPTWFGLCTAHLDKKHESFEWSFYSTVAGLGSAITGAIGAFIAQYLGFAPIFMVASLLCLIGVFVLFFLEREKNKNRLLNIRHKTKKHHR